MGPVAGRRKTQPHQSARTPRSPRQDAFCGQWKTRIFPTTFSVYMMVIWGECTSQTTSRQRGHSHWWHLCHILPCPWCALQHSDGWLWEPSGWLGAPGGSKYKLIFRPTSSPETHHLLNYNFQAKSSNFPQLKSGKGYETIWVRKPKVVFCYFAWSTRGTSLKFQMCSSWIKCVSTNLHSSLRKTAAGGF